jgi:hypothetical protein
MTRSGTALHKIDPDVGCRVLAVEGSAGGWEWMEDP